MTVLLQRLLALRTQVLEHGLAKRSAETDVAVVIATLCAATAATSIVAARSATSMPPITTPGSAAERIVDARRRADFAAMETFRPGYEFWRHVFTLPDGSIAYGSASDGRLLATFPVRGEWSRHAAWADRTLAGLLDGQQLARSLDDRREQVAELLEREAGPVLQNSTRGDALLRNAPKYGTFVAEWGAIYERFGVPADIGLAQVILESGLNGTRRSKADAVGFCQWLRSNWKLLKYFSGAPIEEQNQTSQAPYCAAYLSVLATKYGSFIPALSEHNAGGTNVGRALINGEHLGARDVRARYFLGSKLARDLRTLRGREYEDVYHSYGPRSYRYAEMVFGNTLVVQRLITSTPQQSIYAMRTSRAMSLAEIVKRTGLTNAEVQRFNPALVAGVPAHGTLYLPYYVSGFGADVAFWRRPASPSYLAVLDDFVRLDAGAEQWDDPAFAPVLADFRRRFRKTNTEEGAVMDTVLAYVMDQAYTSGRRELLFEFRRDEQVQRLIDRGVRELATVSQN
jgi:hypothetical protein